MSKRVSPSRLKWLVAGCFSLGAIAIVCLVVLVPVAVRALPGRYAARLPGFLQDLRRRPHPDTLPTPAVTVAPVPSIAPTPTSPRLSGVTFLSATPTHRGEAGGGWERESPTPQATARPTRWSTEQPTATATRMPTGTSTPTPTPSPTPTPTQLPLSASLPPITHTYQTWNNCGPATLSMALQYFAYDGTQADAAAFLKPDPEDRNVSPYEMAAFVRSLGLEGQVRVGGDLGHLKQLIGAGLPVVVETWFIPEPDDEMGHYRVLTGYDDAARHFTAQDSYNGPNVRLGYDAFDELWRVFNRVYLVVYRPSQAEQLAAILAEDLDDETMYRRALDVARAEAASPSEACVAYEECADGAAFAWFNVGSNLTSLGQHQDAVAAYDQARLLGLPWRTLWYQFGPYESYYAVGRYDDVITLATVTLNVTANLEESLYWRGMAYLAQEEPGRARDDFQAALGYNPNFYPARQALESLN